MKRLTIATIVKDEEQHLPALLESVRGVADELLVVDAGSTDRTVEIALAAGARVLHRDWTGYGPQRLFAVARASNDWVLSLDADERLSPELRAAIRAEMERPDEEAPAAYKVAFRHRALGRRIRFGEMLLDRRIRLFDRRRAGYDGAMVHEKVVARGPVGLLRGRCEHEGPRDAAGVRAKLRAYAEGVARERFRNGRRPAPWDALRWPFGFLKRYVLRLGFLDGRAGLLLALLYARYDADKGRWFQRFQAEESALGAPMPER